jgi:hypothetical protein
MALLATYTGELLVQGGNRIATGIATGITMSSPEVKQDGT